MGQFSSQTLSYKLLLNDAPAWDTSRHDRPGYSAEKPHHPRRAHRLQSDERRELNLFRATAAACSLFAVPTIHTLPLASSCHWQPVRGSPQILVHAQGTRLARYGLRVAQRRDLRVDVEERAPALERAGRALDRARELARNRRCVRPRAASVLRKVEVGTGAQHLHCREEAQARKRTKANVGVVLTMPKHAARKIALLASLRVISSHSHSRRRQRPNIRRFRRRGGREMRRPSR